MILKNIWQGYWARHHTHEYGMCYPIINSKKFYVNIPKNATNWAKGWAKKNNLRISNYHATNLLEQDYQPIIFLREPLDRWYSGITEYLHRYGVVPTNYQFSEDILSLLLERVAFDEHTEEQALFLENIDTENCIFFRVDDNLIANFKHYCEHELGQDPNLIRNNKDHATVGYKKELYNRLKSSIQQSVYTHRLTEQTQPCEERLKDYYSLDYKLYNSVQYYIKGQ